MSSAGPGRPALPTTSRRLADAQQAREALAGPDRRRRRRATRSGAALASGRASCHRGAPGAGAGNGLLPRSDSAERRWSAYVIGRGSTIRSRHVALRVDARRARRPAIARVRARRPRWSCPCPATLRQANDAPILSARACIPASPRWPSGTGPGRTPCRRRRCAAGRRRGRGRPRPGPGCAAACLTTLWSASWAIR